MQNVGVYETERYTAYIYHNKVLICTRLQTFRITTIQPCSKEALNSLKIDILNGKVKNIGELGTKEGKLKWEHTTSSPSY